MASHKLHHTEGLDPVLRVQRAVSRARTEAELIYNFVKEIRVIGHVTEYVELAVVEGRSDAFVIADFNDLTDPELSRETVMRHNKWPEGLDRETIHTGGLLGALLEGETPKLLHDVGPDDDPRLKGIVRAQRDALAVPVYFEGHITQWSVVFRERGLEMSETDVRIACATLNMLSRGAFQLRLQQRVEAMHERERAKIEEIGAIQRSLLPVTPPKHPAVEISTHYCPTDLAGGDYYDFRVFADGSKGFVIADVAGHGPGAAVVMSMMRTAMYLQREFGFNEENIVSTMNSFLCDGVSPGLFVTAFFMRLDPSDGALEYANAGHCPPRLRRADGTLETLQENATMPLGILADIEVGGALDRLGPGDTVVLYTDGINEAFNSEGELFGYERLDETLRALPLDATADETRDAIINAVDTFAAGHPADDDRCVVVVRYTG